MAKYKLAIHIFRRDLRLDDNTALNEALKSAEKVLPCFILDDRQLSAKNAYRSDNALQFMFASLADLDRQLRNSGGKLYLFAGLAHEIIEKLILNHRADAVFVNSDYTPFSIERDKEIENICQQHHIGLHSYADTLLTQPGTVLKNDGKPYTVFTPFYRKAKELQVQKPQAANRSNYFNNPVDSTIETESLIKNIPNPNKNLFLKGGRNEALDLLARLSGLRNYEISRNIPSEDGTSKLSAHLKFGTLSAREVFWEILLTLGENQILITEIYWRDFFTHIAWHFPQVFGNAFHAKYNKIEWENDPKKFEAWQLGETGFPIVDAGMRQLNTTGWMHNRVRMITASFLVKDLHIDWRWGERYFAQKLIDYDPAVNNGNWQWAASTGCDAQPYFRIFNPWLQQKKYDPECSYIKTWLPELRNLSNVQTHNWFKAGDAKTAYPLPIINHSEASKITKETYTVISRQK